jgi:hypothetical protein
MLGHRYRVSRAPAAPGQRRGNHEGRGGLGDGHVPGAGHEPAERGVGDGVIIHPHAVHPYGGDRSFLGVKRGAAHPEHPTRNQGHALANHDPTSLTVGTWARILRDQIQVLELAANRRVDAPILLWENLTIP